MSDKIQNNIPVLLCGGSGTRLWPVSRASFPKQFNQIYGEYSFFQQTILRLHTHFADIPLIITANSMKFLVLHQLQEIGQQAVIIAESDACNSGPAILLAGCYVQKHHPDKIMTVFASDHVIEGNDAFHRSLVQAEKAVQSGYLTTFGIMPTHPATGYGYIAYESAESQDFHPITAFIEKPTIDKAELYLQKKYVWNSGNFMMNPSLLMAEYQNFDSHTVQVVQNSFTQGFEDCGAWVTHSSYANADKISIDYAVMEKTQKAAVVIADFSWSDAGTWQSLYDLSAKDLDGNVFYGDEIVTQNTHNSYVHNQSEQLVCVSNLDDIAVINTKDAVLISKKDNADSLKSLLTLLKADQRPQASLHKKTYRPWGWYETLILADRFQVKHIQVSPKASLSLQAHMHRAEHWIVVSGTAEVTNDENILILTENQSTYIPIGAKHRLKNVGVIPLEIIEIQSGSYLGEDDIIRFEDLYNRL